MMSIQVFSGGNREKQLYMFATGSLVLAETGLVPLEFVPRELANNV